MLFILLLVVFKIIKCNDWNEDGTEYNTIIVNEHERKFFLYNPSPNKELPLWILLHGQAGNVKEFIENTDFFMVAEEKEVIAVFPEGHCYEEIAQMCCWNTGHLRSLSKSDWNIDDIAFLEELITQLKIEYKISEIIITGFSAGAFMTHTYAINTTKHEIFAILPVAGHIGGIGYYWQEPVSYYDPNTFGVQSVNRPHVVTIFGTNDAIVSIKGGVTFDGRIDFSMKQDLDFWMNANECINQHISFNYYDMNNQIELEYFGEQCKKLVASVTFIGVTHFIESYDKKFSGVGKNFAKFSKTLSEFLFNLVEYEIKKKTFPNEDPDPEPPTDGDYQYIPWSFSSSTTETYICIFIYLLIINILL